MGVGNTDHEVEALVQSATGQGGTDKRLVTFALASQHAALVRRSGVFRCFPRSFVCDAGLGGLARWLRGSGFEAFWKPELDDAAVIREAQHQQATLITTDSLMMERGILRDGVVPSVFVPST